MEVALEPSGWVQILVQPLPLCELRQEAQSYHL